MVAPLSAALLCAAGHQLGVPSVPPPISQNAVALQSRIASAPNGSTVTLDANGRYTFSNSTLLISAAAGVTLDGNGATLVFYYGFGVLLQGCTAVTVRNLTLDSDPPNYAQGSVRSLGPGRTVLAAFDPAFLMPDTAVPPFNNPGGHVGAKVHFWGPDRIPLPGTSNFLNASEATGGGAGEFRITLLNRAPASLPDGAFVTVFGRRGRTMDTEDSARVVVEDVVIHAGGNMGFHEQGGAGGNTYRRVRIERKPGYLMALNADGFHSSAVGRGPLLQDSVISFTGDE